MKKFVAIIGLAISLVSVSAQTNSPATNNPVLSGPGWEAIQFLASGSNWMFGAYGIVSQDDLWGAGVGAFYKTSPWVAVGLRMDSLWGASGGPDIWMPSGNFQLSLPLKLFNKVEVTPFTYAGIATPIAGKGKENGSVVGIFGGGVAVPLTFVSQKLRSVDIVYDYEIWSGAGFDNSQQHRFGLLYKF